jgi:glycosyltransferase involved in cell wall biosynthesis
MSIAFPSEIEIVPADVSDGQSELQGRPLLSLVIPVRDAAGSLPATLNAITRWIAGSSIRAEVVVVDDGSSDGTRATATSFERRIANLQVLRHVERRGRLEAIRTGGQAARGELIAFGRADDLETALGATTDLMAAVLRGAECAYVPGSSESRTTPHPYPLPPSRSLTGAWFGWIRGKISRSVRQPAFMLWRADALRHALSLIRVGSVAEPDWVGLASRADCSVNVVRRDSPAAHRRLRSAPMA